MKLAYEQLEIDIELMSSEDVITTSGLLEDETDHDNSYVDWGELE